MDNSVDTFHRISGDRVWANEYLKDLRTNKPSRPTGARPLPTRNETRIPRDDAYTVGTAASAMVQGRSGLSGRQEVPERSASAMSHRQTSITSNLREFVGSPVARPPIKASRNVSGTSNSTMMTSTTRDSTGPDVYGAGQTYKIPYYERGQRWMERQEMASLSRALEEKDLVEEQRIYSSAQDEAADLVWKHQNPGAPYPNPDKSNLRAHLKQGSHARTLSNGPYETLFVKKFGADGSRSASNGSDVGQRSASDSSQGSDGSRNRRFSNLSFSMRSASGAFRKIGSKKGRSFSMERKQNPFPNPQDQIYEEADDVVQTIQDVDKPMPLRIRPRNTSYGKNPIKDKTTRINEQSENTTPMKVISTVEIYKNSPSQSRNAEYRTNSDPCPTTEKQSFLENGAQPGNPDRKEVRGEDIRAATSQKLKDRSPKLPMPTAVSDRPGRPIVSFQKDYSPRRKELQHEIFTSVPQSDKRKEIATKPTIPLINFQDAPSIQIAAPNAIPAISLPDGQNTDSILNSLPSFSFTSEDENVPSISISSTAPAVKVTTPAARPLPRPTKTGSPSIRPLSSQGRQLATKSVPHWSPSTSRGTAQCAACALPIAGKIVSAASKRFHPHCFTCFCCGELLECVAFYPEPEKFRAERLARIQSRLDGTNIIPEQAHFSEEDDGDDGLRFYCHLDFHEKFSPRCKSCKTPIEGQAIVACGAEWHVGHFFCAECGDPFSADMPFVEKDGFAWCVNCHTRRFSGKCAGCRKPITDLVVSAMGKEWHEECFKCKVMPLLLHFPFALTQQECGDKFSDGRFFTRGEDEIPVCVGCEERRLKA